MGNVLAKFTLTNKKVVLEIEKSIQTLANRIITDAIQKGASDVHILPCDSETVIKYRLGNQLLIMCTLEKSVCERLTSHFKFIASMDIGDRRRPQSGSYFYSHRKANVGLRISTLPVKKSESMVIRILPQQQQIPLYQLSLFPATTKKLHSLLTRAHGLIILTGPTGSGKTTTLYSLLSEASKMIDRNIITLEDPIEKQCDTVLQVQVNEKAGISYATGLKAILRHDPDIIMVGEIRDQETAEIAIRAALTGHLVLTTMHTRDSKGAVYRLLEFGINWLEIEQTLIAVTAQRLVELTCPYCQGECHPYCYTSGRAQRGSVFELLTGSALSAVLMQVKGRKEAIYYETLRDVIKKGIALGFIKENEWNRWVFDE
ncbi:competence type IV pilus ATPase ComGA [Bacillus sp. B15-48]|uniref:competence type IV pilus ATPase ComGA n=1 Tax=Bacillus sp. B15-48 TaxID=1548601 RepID=UPI00193F1538|nr:competence type IV pilus ATPase ComGA [Bacillus sp. B15-48]MBM4762279.1 competence protein ComG [Bacillus sp. B15-48]